MEAEQGSYPAPLSMLGRQLDYSRTRHDDALEM
jgi:hypothetical protein